MGNDGGSIPTRRELVKSAARLPTVSELKASALEALTHAWQTDPVSSDPLDLENAVSDWRGRLYNYETILQGLMPSADNSEDAVKDGQNSKDKNDMSSEDVVGRDLTFADTGIRSIRDVVRLHGTRAKPTASAAARWQCPVTLKELGPTAKAVYLVPCGHVFSEAAVDTFLPDLQCPECSAAFAATNIVAILPTDKADLARLRLRVEALRAEGLTHSLKKDKSAGHGDKKSKKSKRKAGAEDGADKKEKNGSVADTAHEAPPTKKKKERSSGIDANGINSRINNPMTAALTAKVLAEQDALQKRRKMAESRS